VAPEMGGLGMRTFFFFSSLLPPRVGGWVAPHIAVVTRRTFAPPSPQKKGKSLSRRDPKNTSEFLCENFMYEMGGGAFHLPPLCWADYVVKRIPWFTSRVHILHMFRVFPDHVFFQLSNHIISETDRTKHMAAWSGQNIWLHGPTREKKSFKKQTWDAIPWGGKGFYQGHVSSVPTVKP